MYRTKFTTVECRTYGAENCLTWSPRPYGLGYLVSRLRRLLIDLGEGADVEFEGLVILALDLEFGLELLDQEFEVRNFCTKFVNVGGGGCGAVSRWRGLRRRLLGGGVRLLRESFRQGAGPDGITWTGFYVC